jgi:sulfhydrogenase subunit gamma (sulfur reductase)
MTRVKNSNSMLPYLGKLVEIKDLATDIKLLGIELVNGKNGVFSDYRPGQFAFISAFGIGEAPFGITSIPSQGDILEFAVQRLGGVTTGLHELGEGDLVGVRGPFGRSFPMEEFKGKDLIVLGGGIGGAPLRPVIQAILASRSDYGHLTILWAARHPSLMIFTDELNTWRAASDTELHLIVDEADETWKHDVGLITELLEKVGPSPENLITITCGPPIMIHFVSKTLKEMGFSTEQEYVTLEARMHCGIGKCGRCNIGEKLVCIDGPVFSMEEVENLPESFL